jgi:hypothetical protein
VQVADLDLDQVRMGKVRLGKAQGDEGSRGLAYAGVPRRGRRELHERRHASTVSQGPYIHTPVPRVILGIELPALGNVVPLKRAGQMEADAACALGAGRHVHCHDMGVSRVNQRSQQVRDPCTIALGA